MPGTMCRKQIEGVGTLAFQCRVTSEAPVHQGPCAAPERAVSVKARRDWLAAVGHPGMETFSDPPVDSSVAIGSLAAHVAADQRTEAVEETGVCPFCLGVASEICDNCHGTGLDPATAKIGPYYFVHAGPGKPLEAFIELADGTFEIQARLDWSIDAGRIVYGTFGCSLPPANGADLGAAMKEFLEGRGQEGQLGVAYDGRTAPPSAPEPEPIEATVVAEGEAQPDPDIIDAHNMGAHDGMSNADCPACQEILRASGESFVEAIEAERGEPTKQRAGDQPLPVVNTNPVIQGLVRDDLVEREKVGISRYGNGLQAENSRDMLLDAYEEALDLTVYLRGEREERRIRHELTVELTQILERVFPPEGVAPSGGDGDVDQMFSILDRLQRLSATPPTQ